MSRSMSPDMSRIPPLDTAALSPRQRQVHDAIVSGPRGEVPGPLAVWLARPDLADHAQSLGRYCRYESSLEPRLSELAILITARHWSAEFEWQAHKPIALAARLPADVVEAVRTRQRPASAAPDEQAVYDFAHELLEERCVGEATFARAREILGHEGVVDLTGILGYYGLISMTIKAFAVPPLYPAVEMD